ncbi:MAG: isoaspartyl peptidase/L-asparaginase [Planctomycetia bacterium]|nr:isoaspartyl peptidase/L-asparaginase [Planctomycetia bacterium]
MRASCLCLVLCSVLWTLHRRDVADSQAPPAAPEQGPAKKAVLIIHGGAGPLTEAAMKQEGLRREHFEQVLAQSLRAGHQALKTGASVDGVEAAIRVLEDSELFNAGRGAAFTADGRVELDASLMEGKVTRKGEGKRDPRKRAGAVAGVTHVKNPISAARAVMEMPDSRHVLLAGEGAEAFLFGDPNRIRQYRLERVSNLYFWTDRRLRQVREAHQKDQARPGADRRLGTVGAVALDRHQHLAAGTSTGGLTYKLPGRIGDSPLIGAGTYADDRACGVSCTGTGEVFIRHAVAHDVVARMLYGKSTVADAVRQAIDELPDEPEGVGGLIALDRDGQPVFGMSPQSVGMYRGYITEDGQVYVAIYRTEREKFLPAAPEKPGAEKP